MNDFSHRPLQIWNSLPESIRNAGSLPSYTTEKRGGTAYLGIDVAAVVTYKGI